MLSSDITTTGTLYIVADEGDVITLDFGGHTATVEGEVISGIDVSGSLGEVVITDSEYDPEKAPESGLVVHARKVADAACGINANFQTSANGDVNAIPSLAVSGIKIEANIDTVAVDDEAIDGATTAHDCYGLYAAYEKDDARKSIDISVENCSIEANVNALSAADEDAESGLSNNGERVLSEDDRGVAYAIYTNQPGITLEGMLATSVDSAQTCDLYSIPENSFVLGPSFSPANAMRIYVDADTDGQGNSDGVVFARVDDPDSIDIESFVNASDSGCVLSLQESSLVFLAASAANAVSEDEPEANWSYGEEGFETFDQALAAAVASRGDGALDAVIELGADVAEGYAAVDADGLAAGDKVTIDLAGHSLPGVYVNTAADVAVVSDGGERGTLTGAPMGTAGSVGTARHGIYVASKSTGAVSARGIDIAWSSEGPSQSTTSAVYSAAKAPLSLADVAVSVSDSSPAGVVAGVYVTANLSSFGTSLEGCTVAVENAAAGGSAYGVTHTAKGELSVSSTSLKATAGGGEAYAIHYKRGTLSLSGACEASGTTAGVYLNGKNAGYCAPLEVAADFSAEQPVSLSAYLVSEGDAFAVVAEGGDAPAKAAMFSNADDAGLAARADGQSLVWAAPEAEEDGKLTLTVTFHGHNADEDCDGYPHQAFETGDDSAEVSAFRLAYRAFDFSAWSRPEYTSLAKPPNNTVDWLTKSGSIYEIRSAFDPCLTAQSITDAGAEDLYPSWQKAVYSISFRDSRTGFYIAYSGEYGEPYLAADGSRLTIPADPVYPGEYDASGNPKYLFDGWRTYSSGSWGEKLSEEDLPQAASKDIAYEAKWIENPAYDPGYDGEFASNLDLAPILEQAQAAGTSVTLLPGSYYLSRDVSGLSISVSFGEKYTQTIIDNDKFDSTECSVDLQGHTLGFGVDGEVKSGTISATGGSHLTLWSSSGRGAVRLLNGGGIRGTTDGTILKMSEIDVYDIATLSSGITSFGSRAAVSADQADLQLENCTVNVDYTAYKSGGGSVGGGSSTLNGQYRNQAIGVLIVNTKVGYTQDDTYLSNVSVSVKTGTPDPVTSGTSSTTTYSAVDAIGVFVRAATGEGSSIQVTGDCSFAAEAQQGSAYAFCNYWYSKFDRSAAVEFHGSVALKAVGKSSVHTALSMGIVNSTVSRADESTIGGSAVLLDGKITFDSGDVAANAYALVSDASSTEASKAPFVIGEEFDTEPQLTVGLGATYNMYGVSDTVYPMKPVSVNAAKLQEGSVIASYAVAPEENDAGKYADAFLNGVRTNPQMSVVSDTTSVWLSSEVDHSNAAAYIQRGDDRVYFASFEGAAKAAESGETVVLNKGLADAALVFPASDADNAEDESFGVDLNGKAVGSFVSQSSATIKLFSSAEGAVVLGTRSGAQITGIEQAGTGTLRVEGIDVRISNASSASYGILASAGALELQGATVSLQSGANTIYGVYVRGGASCTVADSSILSSQSSPSAGAYGIFVEGKESKVDVSGSTVEVSGEGSMLTGAYVSGGQLLASGSQVSISAVDEGSLCYGFLLTNAATATLEGCSATISSQDAQAQAKGWCVLADDTESSLLLSGVSTLKSSVAAGSGHISAKAPIALSGSFALSDESDSPVSVRNGSYTTGDLFAKAADGQTLSDGVTSLFAPSEDSVYSGRSLVLSEDGLELGWSNDGVVAEIGGKGYTSLLAAVAAAASGDKIDIVADIDMAAPVVIDKNLSIDLNGHTVDITAPTTPQLGAITVNKGLLTIADSNVKARGVPGVVRLHVTYSGTTDFTIQEAYARGGAAGFSLSGSLSLEDSAVKVTYEGSEAALAVTGVFCDSASSSFAMQGSSSMRVDAGETKGALKAYGVWTNSADGGSVNIGASAKIEVSNSLAPYTTGDIYNAFESSSAIGGGTSNNASANESKYSDSNLKEFLPEDDSELYEEICDKFLSVAVFDDGSLSGSNNTTDTHIYYASPMFLDDGTAVWAFSEPVSGENIGKAEYIVPAKMYVQTTYQVSPDAIGIGAATGTKASIAVEGSVETVSQNGSSFALRPQGGGTWLVDGADLTATSNAETPLWIRTQNAPNLATELGIPVEKFASKKNGNWLGGVSIRHVKEIMPQAAAIAEYVSDNVHRPAEVVNDGLSIILSGEVSLEAQGTQATDVKANLLSLASSFGSSAKITLADRSGDVSVGSTFAASSDEAGEITEAQMDAFLAADGTCAPVYAQDAQGSQDKSALCWGRAYTVQFKDYFGNVVSQIDGVAAGRVIDLPSAEDAKRPDTTANTYPLVGWSLDSNASEGDQGVIPADQTMTFDPASDSASTIVYYAVYGKEAKPVTLTFANARDASGNLIASQKVTVAANVSLDSGKNAEAGVLDEIPAASSYVDASGTHVFAGWTFTRNNSTNCIDPLCLGSFLSPGDLTLTATYVDLPSDSYHAVMFKVDDYVVGYALEEGLAPNWSDAYKAFSVASSEQVALPQRSEAGVNWTFVGWNLGHDDDRESVDEALYGSSEELPAVSDNDGDAVYYTAKFRNDGKSVSSITLHYWNEWVPGSGTWSYNEQKISGTSGVKDSYNVTYGFDMTSWVRGEDGIYTFDDPGLQTVKIRDYVEKLDDGSYKAHRFRGWSVRMLDEAPLAKDALDPDYSAGTLSLVGGATSSYYAIYTDEDMPVNVVFKDGTEVVSEVVSSSQKTLEDAMSLSGYVEPSAPDGKVFLGWHYDASSSRAIANPEQSFLRNASTFLAPSDGDGKAYGEVTYYAVYGDKANTVITFDCNGTTMNVGGSSVEVFEDEFQQGTVVGQSILPSRAGFAFCGWNTQKDGSGDWFDTNLSQVPEENLTVYAQWAPIDSYVRTNHEAVDTSLATVSSAWDTGATRALVSFVATSGYDQRVTLDDIKTAKVLGSYQLEVSMSSAAGVRRLSEGFGTVKLTAYVSNSDASSGKGGVKVYVLTPAGVTSVPCTLGEVTDDDLVPISFSVSEYQPVGESDQAVSAFAALAQDSSSLGNIVVVSENSSDEVELLKAKEFYIEQLRLTFEQYNTPLYEEGLYTNASWESAQAKYKQGVQAVTDAKTASEAEASYSQYWNALRDLAPDVVQSGDGSGSDGDGSDSGDGSSLPSTSNGGLVSSGGSGLSSSGGSGLSSGSTSGLSSGSGSGLTSGLGSSGLTSASSSLPGSSFSTSGTMLGGSFETVDDSLVADKGLAVDHGVYVSSVDEDGPLDAAGVKAGDVITALNGTEVTSVEQLEELLRDLESGDEVEVSLNRDGQDLVLKATLDEDVSDVLSAFSTSDDAIDEVSGEVGFVDWLMSNIVLAILCLLGILAAVGAAIWWLLRRRHSDSLDDDDFFEEGAGSAVAFDMA